MPEPLISIYPSHDSSLSVLNSEGQYRVFEFERLTKERFVNMDFYDGYNEIFSQLKNIIEKECGDTKFDTCYALNLSEKHRNSLTKHFGINTYKETFHHISHAACSFYQSPFNEALVISYDGGGYDGGFGDERIGFFNIYLADRKGGVSRIAHIHLDLGTSYGLIGIPISEINKTPEDWGKRFLTFAGKLMGLVAYGEVKNEWLESMEKFYWSVKDLSQDSFHEVLTNCMHKQLGFNTIKEQESYDLAATSQQAFENLIWRHIEPYLLQYKRPVCLTGGCALNVIFNQKLRDKLDVPLFVPPNPNDCGLSFGMLALNTKPENSVDLMYSGFPVLDIDELDKYVLKYNARKINETELARELYSGKIIGVMRGNSEHGPRALGNRSILCNPGIAEMKDTLNSRVKFREWFRPFAPLVRVENVSKYFHFDGEAPYMSYSPMVRAEWKEKLPAIVHKDGSARVQTIKQEQNLFMYNLLNEFEKLSGYDVLLNTSFNVRGKPILTTIADAIDVLENTEIDAVLIENYLFTRNKCTI